GEKRRSHPISGAYLRQERVVRYRFIDGEKPLFPLGLLCRVMRVSKSGYYLYARGKSYVLSVPKARLAEQVKETFYLHRRRYGARRIAAELRAEGNCIGRAAVRTLMRRQNLRAIQPRRFVPRTTDSRHTIEPSPNLLLELENAAQRPRDVIVGDITYLPLQSGKWSYLASWQDQFSKRIVGWAVAERMTDDLVIKALEKAIRSGSVTGGTIIHTDRGGQYVSNNFRALLQAHKCRQSMSRRANCWDNGVSRKGLRVQRVEVPPGEESGPRSRVAVGRETELLKPTVERHFKVASKLPGLNASEPGGSFEMT
nr:IS3 family transposase [Pyrinomonadaceae bacterium]